LKTKNFISKNFHKFINISLLRKLNNDKRIYQRIICDIKKIIEEKTEIINKAEKDKHEISFNSKNILIDNKSLVDENEILRKKILNLELKINEDNIRFKELWNQNMKDILSKFLF